LRRVGGHLLIQLLLHCCEIEACALLHRRELKEGLRLLPHLVLKKDETPEFVGPPIFREECVVASPSEAPMSEVTWQREPEFIGADHAERARIGDYELVVFDLPAERARPAVVGWELTAIRS
jgi:hypothetical protein